MLRSQDVGDGAVVSEVYAASTFRVGHEDGRIMYRLTLLVSLIRMM
jgi:hypothetical protein